MSLCQRQVRCSACSREGAAWSAFLRLITVDFACPRGAATASARAGFRQNSSRIAHRGSAPSITRSRHRASSARWKGGARERKVRGDSISRSIRGRSPRGGSRLCPRRGRQAPRRRAFPAPPSAPAGRSRRAGLLLYGCAARARFVFRHGSPFRERFLRSASENGAHRGRCRPPLCNKGKILKKSCRGRHGEAKEPRFARSFFAGVVLFAKENMLCAEPRGGVPRGGTAKQGDILLVEENIPLNG